MHAALGKKILLGCLPTPLQPMDNLSSELGGPRLYIKRDDQTGLALGGNKTRKLEYILADALAQGADCIITAGAQQSNHCRQTAAAAAKLGLDCHLMLGGHAPTAINGNLLLDQLFGAEIHWCGEHRKGEDIPALVTELKARGCNPYVVPYGGSNVLGACGFAAAMLELQQQCQQQHVEFSHIVFASSSGGTHAGMLAGRDLCGINSQILGIANDKQGLGNQGLKRQVFDLTRQTLEYLNIPDSLSERDVQLNTDYIADGYGVINQRDIDAIKRVARLEGILLDPVYTGRAMGAMLDLIEQGYFKADQSVLFWHTGGSPALFANAAQLTLSAD